MIIGPLFPLQEDCPVLWARGEGEQGTDDHAGSRLPPKVVLPVQGYFATAAFRASTRSVRSQVKSSPVRPKWPFAAVWV